MNIGPHETQDTDSPFTHPIQQETLGELLELIRQVNLPGIKSYIMNTSSVNLKDEIAHALKFSCYNGYDSVVQLLIDEGAKPDQNINLRDWTFATPLHVAAMWGRTDVAKVLIERGADLNALAYNYVQTGWTPLHFAAFYGHTAMVELLLSSKANKSLLVHTSNFKDFTPICLAALKNNTEIVQRFIENGVKYRQEISSSMIKSTAVYKTLVDILNIKSPDVLRCLKEADSIKETSYAIIKKYIYDAPVSICLATTYDGISFVRKRTFECLYKNRENWVHLDKPQIEKLQDALSATDLRPVDIENSISNFNFNLMLENANEDQTSTQELKELFMHAALAELENNPEEENTTQDEVEQFLFNGETQLTTQEIIQSFYPAPLEEQDANPQSEIVEPDVEQLLFNFTSAQSREHDEVNPNNPYKFQRSP